MTTTNAAATEPESTSSPSPVPASPSPGRSRPPLNAFGISFGLTGLAGTWTEAAHTLHSPLLVGEAVWVVAAIVWVATIVVYLSRAHSLANIRADLHHPVLAPFAALVPVPGMLMGAHLSGIAPVAGAVIVWAMFAVTAVFGGWFVSRLLTAPTGFATVHGGYFLPTVAAGLISAQSLATIGDHEAAVAAFGVGLLFWMLLGGAVLARLIAGPELPPALLPTLAIFSAPPAVAGNAWWVMDGARGGVVAELLTGAMVIVLLPHLFLIRRYLRLPFALGFWALTFTTAASATYGVRLLSLVEGAWATAASWIVVGITTLIIGAIGVRSLALLRPHPRGE